MSSNASAESTPLSTPPLYFLHLNDNAARQQQLPHSSSSSSESPSVPGSSPDTTAPTTPASVSVSPFFSTFTNHATPLVPHEGGERGEQPGNHHTTPFDEDFGPSSFGSADYDIDARTGFLPSVEPIQRLTNSGAGERPGMENWEMWEVLLERAEKECWLEGWSSEGGKDEEDDGSKAEVKRRELAALWRKEVEEMPETDTTPVSYDLPTLRRAYLVLAFLTHFYVHSIGAGDDELKKEGGKKLRKVDEQDTSVSNGEGLNGKGSDRVMRVPRSLARPFWDVSRRLGLPPVLTYAATVLWNWRMKEPTRGLALDNLEIITTFTPKASPTSPNSSLVSSEAAFYLSSLCSELFSARLLSHIRSCLLEAFVPDSLAQRRIGAHLRGIATLIREMIQQVKETVKGVEPQEFYWRIRGWFMGGRWKFEGIGTNPEDEKEEDVEMDLGGPSAGQSTLLHAIDVFLGIDHSPKPNLNPGNLNTRHGSAAPIPGIQAAAISSGGNALPSPFSEEEKTPKPSPFASPDGFWDARQPSPKSPDEFGARRDASSESSSKPTLSPTFPIRLPPILKHPAPPPPALTLHDQTFMARMSSYMPYRHRLFLQHLSNPLTHSDVPALTIREIVMQDQPDGEDDSGLKDAYDDAVMAMKEFRDEHIRIVAKYIILQARRGRHNMNSSTSPSSPPPNKEGSVPKAPPATLAEARAKKRVEDGEELKGTGGTDLVRFLKMSRTRTLEARVGDPSGFGNPC